ncbi:MAG: hypothetical protein LRY40_04670, partial [Shewanella fodinae]|nr:hypothetical protein [Shewanella fodinae]
MPALAQVDNIQDTARFHMWQQGGLIAAGGLILGVILVYLPRPQRAVVIAGCKAYILLTGRWNSNSGLFYMC